MAPMSVSYIESWKVHWNEEKSEKLMVEGSHAPNKRERAANTAQRQQESEQHSIRAGRIEGNASKFHWATFYHGDTELKWSISVQDTNWEKWNTYGPGDRRNGANECFVTTHGLNVMHSGHVGPPGIIFRTYLSFHSTLTPVLLVRYISIPSSTYPVPIPFDQILYTRYPSPYATRI